MTDNQIRIAVAEACGWKKEYICGNGIDDEVWICPKTNQCWLAEDAVLPDYLNDLNAMHEAEKVLTEEGVNAWWVYVGHINRNNPTPFGVESAVHATARQRCLAFLKTKGIIP